MPFALRDIPDAPPGFDTDPKAGWLKWESLCVLGQLPPGDRYLSISPDEAY